MSNISLNIKYIIKTWIKIMSGFSAIVTIFLTFSSWEDMNISKPSIKLLILLCFCIIFFIISFVSVIFFIRVKQVWKKGKNEVKAMYDDIFEIAFSNNKNKRIIVIPVNDTFETIVDEPGEGVVNALVSPNTIHGRWIKKYSKETGTSIKELNERIQKDLMGRQSFQKRIEKNITRGNKYSYPIGTVSVINGPKNCIFYLLAISKFDENNNAQSTKRQIRDSIDELMEFYDKNGQQYPIYIPLIGTGTSRAGLTHEQSLRVIKSTVLTNEKSINGEINIVVYEKDKDKVSIFK